MTSPLLHPPFQPGAPPAGSERPHLSAYPPAWALAPIRDDLAPARGIIGAVLGCVAFYAVLALIVVMA